MYKSRKQENFKKANVPPLLGRAGAIGRVDKFYFFQTSRKQALRKFSETAKGLNWQTYKIVDC